MAYPGQAANGVVRVLGLFTIIASVGVAVWLLSTTTEVSEDAAALVGVAALAFFLNGLLGGALLIVFGAMGENIIGIRRANDVANAKMGRGTQPIATAKTDNLSAEGIETRSARCTVCQKPLKTGAKFCRYCLRKV